MQRVLVLDRHKQPLMPCHPARARALLRQGKAAVFRRYPFTLILKDRADGDTQSARLKLDPGSKTTGLTLVAEFARRGQVVVWAAELQHRGDNIRNALHDRWSRRRSRRNRKTRYRAPRFSHRTRPEGWLPPSLQHRVDTSMTWVQRLRRWAPVSAVSQELVRFDTQALQNPEITGIEYQQGTLFGYEVREYLLEKWGRQCAYCDAENVPLEIEHIHPKSRGGSDRVSNLTIACHDCNQEKDDQDLALFLGKAKGRYRRMLRNARTFAGKDTKKLAQRLAQEESRLQRIQRQAKAPLRDAAAVNSTRWALWRQLVATGLDVEVGTGGRTKWNRRQQHYPKTHWIDAACVGETGAEVVLSPPHKPLGITSAGHGTRRMQNHDKYGFPRGRAKSRQKRYFGYQTGDMVRAVVTQGKKAGLYVGRVLCRASGSFDIQTERGRVSGISHRYLQPMHRQDGYNYAY